MKPLIKEIESKKYKIPQYELLALEKAKRINNLSNKKR